MKLKMYVNKKENVRHKQFIKVKNETENVRYKIY